MNKQDLIKQVIADLERQGAKLDGYAWKVAELTYEYLIKALSDGFEKELNND